MTKNYFTWSIEFKTITLIYTQESYFIILTYSHSQTFWSYQLIIIVHLKEGTSLEVEALPCSGCFTTCLGAHFPTVQKNNVVWFSIVSGLLKGVRVPVAPLQMVLPV